MPTVTTKLTIPVAYAQLVLEQAERRGIPRETLLERLALSPAQLEQVDGRLSLIQVSQLFYRALKLAGPELGYEIALNSHLTSHGFIGYGLLSLPTLRESIEFGIKYVRLRLPLFSLRLFTESQRSGEWGVIEVSESLPLGVLRECLLDMFLVGISRLVPTQDNAKINPEMQLCFDYAEPAHFARYRHRLPAMRFAAGVNQLRFPARFLDLPLKTANPETARLVAQQCERELSLVSAIDDYPARVSALLAATQSGYPSLNRVAAQLSLSSRTLKRRLQDQGQSYQQLLEQSRRRDSLHLLKQDHLSITAIATRLGYTDPANFTRAFRKWTGESPRHYRKRHAPDRLNPADSPFVRS